MYGLGKDETYRKHLRDNTHGTLTSTVCGAILTHIHGILLITKSHSYETYYTDKSNKQ